MEEQKDIFADENLLTEPPVKEQAEPAVEVEKTEAEAEKVEEKKEPEEVVTEIITPPEPFKFANEASEKMFNLFKDGKEDELYNHLHERKILSQVGDMKAEDAIKLKLQKENPEYSPADIQDLFDDKYSMPEKPEQKIDETDEEFSTREGKWKNQYDKSVRRIERSAKEAKAELSKKISEIVLPDIPVNSSKPQEYSQEELAEIEKIRTNYVQSLQKGYNEFNGYATTYKDEEVEIPVEVKIPEKEKAALKERFDNGFDFIDYMQQRYFTKDGIDGKKLMDEIYLLENRDKVFSVIANEAGSKRHNEQIKNQKNINLSGVGTKGSVNHEIDHERKMAEVFFNA